MKKTHVLDYSREFVTGHQTRCGLFTGRALGQNFGAGIASRMQDATCARCRSICGLEKLDPIIEVAIEAAGK